ncbi:hypothetical protein Emed_001843 [Eimeria media]
MSAQRQPIAAVPRNGTAAKAASTTIAGSSEGDSSSGRKSKSSSKGSNVSVSSGNTSSNGSSLVTTAAVKAAARIAAAAAAAARNHPEDGVDGQSVPDDLLPANVIEQNGAVQLGISQGLLEGKARRKESNQAVDSRPGLNRVFENHL